MRRLLVTGASGFLGWHVCQLARAQWEVTGTVRTQTVTLPGVALRQVDLTDPEAIARLLDAVQPDAVIHAAARSKPNDCQQHPEATYAANVTATVALARQCGAAGVPFAFTSTDLVFDGQHAPYAEGDPVAPLSVYGQQKAQAEREVLAVHPEAVVCRMPLMFGSVPPTATTFLQFFLKALRAGEPLRVFVDEYRTPVSGATAARGLLLALQTRGILHLGGRERVSRYEFAHLLAQVMGLAPELLQPCQLDEMPMAAPRAADVALISDRAYALGYDPPSLRQELAALQTQV